MPTAHDSLPGSGDAAKAATRIGFLVRFPFHQEILNPIHALLRDEFPCLITSDVQAVIDFRPRILIVADRFHPRYRKLLPDTLLVFTRHGFISKNYAWGVIGESDFVCVSSPWVREDCVRRGWLPRLGFWVTGFVPMDGILGKQAAPTTRERPAGFSSTGPTLLYAPTHNRCLNSVEMLGTDWIRRLRERSPDLNVIIKPHPHTAERDPAALAILGELAARNERTLLVPPEADIYPFMPLCDVLLSDSSSVMFFFLALDRPIILVNNPQRFQEPQFFDPQGQEWTCRDMAIEIDRAEDLPQALQTCLDHPEQNAEARARYRQQVFGDLLDGCAAARIARQVRTLLKPAPEERDWADLVWSSVRTIGRLMKNLDKAEAKPVGPFTVKLDNYPQLRAAVQRQPELRSEVGVLVEDILREQSRRLQSGSPSSNSGAKNA